MSSRACCVNRDAYWFCCLLDHTLPKSIDFEKKNKQISMSRCDCVVFIKTKTCVKATRRYLSGDTTINWSNTNILDPPNQVKISWIGIWDIYLIYSAVSVQFHSLKNSFKSVNFTQVARSEQFFDDRCVAANTLKIRKIIRWFHWYEWIH